MKRKYRRKITADYKLIGFQCRKNGRDNKDYYHSDGWLNGNRWSIRLPSLKANKKTWDNFYKLFPKIKERLTNPYNYRDEDPDRLILEGDIIIEKLVRYRTINEKSVKVVKTRKYKKTW